ncbi:hypothetical protein [Bradyrhizobium semiaridum]|uniref:hypothetical protein n=1 Tax=Bradyrhizobium semiaridum TaxID=2821404 RepID=UPI001CE2CB58|nr:hypothetical protein [Bradyrhizobium semiaridum]
MKLQLRLAEWQLAQLRQREHDLQNEEIYLVNALNDANLPAGSSSESISRRLAVTGVSARTLRAEAARQLDQVHSESRRVKHLEQVARAAVAGRRRDAEGLTLEEIAGVHPPIRGRAFGNN